jgi:hypothetical protein
MNTIDFSNLCPFCWYFSWIFIKSFHPKTFGQQCLCDTPTLQFCFLMLRFWISRLITKCLATWKRNLGYFVYTDQHDKAEMVYETHKKAGLVYAQFYGLPCCCNQEELHFKFQV